MNNSFNLEQLAIESPNSIMQSSAILPGNIKLRLLKSLILDSALPN